MKTRFFLPWHLGLALVAAVPLLMLLRARGQSAPPPQPAAEAPAAAPAPSVAPAIPGLSAPSAPPPLAVEPPASPAPSIAPGGIPGLSVAPPPPKLAPPRPLPESRALQPIQVQQASPQKTRSAKPKVAVKPLQTAHKLSAQPPSGERYYVEKMKQIVFPSVSFQEASMNEVLDLLRSKGRDYDAVERDPAKKGVNIIVKHDATTSGATVTLDLKDVPMNELLKYATQLSGMAYRVEPYAVVVMPLTEWSNEIRTRNFEVPSDFLTANATEADQTATDILESHGILFPEGANATFLPSSSQLVVRNTEPQLNQVEMLLNSMVQVSPAPQGAAAMSGAPGGVNPMAFVNVPATPPTLTFTAPAPVTPEIIAVESRLLPTGAPDGFLFEADNVKIDRPTTGKRAQQILRDAEARVLMRQFETTVSEIAEGEKALLLEADVAKHGALEAKVRALRDWKSKLEANINKLTEEAGLAGDTLEYGVSYGSVTPAPARVPVPARVVTAGTLSIAPANPAVIHGRPVEPGAVDKNRFIEERPVQLEKQNAEARAAEQKTKAQQLRARPNQFGISNDPNSTSPASTSRRDSSTGAGLPSSSPAATPANTQNKLDDRRQQQQEKAKAATQQSHTVPPAPGGPVGTSVPIPVPAPSLR